MCIIKQAFLCASITGLICIKALCKFESDSISCVHTLQSERVQKHYKQMLYKYPLILNLMVDGIQSEFSVCIDKTLCAELNETRHEN